MTQNLFELATKNKVRFSFKGIITVEDLWDLSLVELNTIYQELSRAKQELLGDSLMVETNTKTKEFDLRIKIVEHIFSTKKAEQEARQTAANKRQKAQYIKSILAEKQNKELLSKSPEELQAILDEIEDLD